MDWIEAAPAPQGPLPPCGGGTGWGEVPNIAGRGFPHPQPLPTRGRGTLRLAACAGSQPAHQHVLGLQELLDAVVGAFAAEPRLLVAAERRYGIGNDALVDADDAAFQRL